MEENATSRECLQLPDWSGIADARTADFERFGQLAHRRTAHHIEDEAKFLPAESLLDIFVQVVALENDAVASRLPNLFGGFFPADDIQRFDSCELCKLDDVLSHSRVGCGLADPVAGHQGNVSAEQEIGGIRINS